MTPQHLNWDSEFFQLNVYSVCINTEIDVSELENSLAKAHADLAYIYTCQQKKGLHKSLISAGARLYDEKVTFRKELSCANECDVANTVYKYSGLLNEDLLQLAFLAGHDSRFRKDNLLEPFYKPMYTKWIENSVSGAIADAVFVHKGKSPKITAMVTCKISGDTGNIGLIATMPESQGKGIGKQLIAAVENYYRAKAVKYSTVVTQQTNAQACRLYESAGFQIDKIEQVYHLWLNKKT